MKYLKLTIALLIAGVTYVSTVGFSSSDKQTTGKHIYFETNDIKEVSRVKDLLSKQDLLKVQQLSVSSAIFKIRLKTKKKDEGGEIEIEVGA